MRQVRSGTEVSCPRCGAKRGEKCRSVSGRTDMDYWHRARIEKKKKKEKKEGKVFKG